MPLGSIRECGGDGPGERRSGCHRAFAGERFHFMAPDALLASTLQADWLIVDEAAAIPARCWKSWYAFSAYY
jgi:tRNA(Met) C34 N-acetyltransferase TmcA